MQLEHELDLRNFSFLVYGFVHSKVLSAEAFVVATRKALLRNHDRVTWEDLSMILVVAEKLDYGDITESDNYLRFV